jgi:hypothetical protein
VELVVSGALLRAAGLDLDGLDHRDGLDQREARA